MATAEVVQRAKQRVGTMLKDKWHLDGLLGVGGSASVYAATHRNQTRAAIKLLHPELSAENEFVKRFLREGYVANTVKHPGVVAILDDDRTDDGLVYIVMELLDGATLERRMRKEPVVPMKEALHIVEQLLGILAAAHEKGVIHRDIKPANIFVTKDNEVKLLDFGIARIQDLAQEGEATAPGLALGTPAFMAPEQARGEWDVVDARSDLYSVGATLWNLLTGKKPREGANSNEELMAAMTKPITPIEAVAEDVPPDVAKWLERTLSFDIKDRWPNAKTMQQALRLAALMGRASLTPPGVDTGPLLVDPESAKFVVRTAPPSLPPATLPAGQAPRAVTPAAELLPENEGRTGKLSSSRFDALGERRARARLAVEDAPELADIEPVPERGSGGTKRRLLLLVLGFAAGFLVVFYLGHLEELPFAQRYLAWLPRLARVREWLHLR